MNFINFNFEVRNKNLNSDSKKEIKKAKDIPTKEDIQPKLARPNSEVLKAYSNVVSFKGGEPTTFDFSALAEKPNYTKKSSEDSTEDDNKYYTTMFPIFNSLKDGTIKNQKFAKLFEGYTVEEIVSIFDDVISKGEQKKFSALISNGNVYNKNSNENRRSIGFKEAKEIIDSGILNSEKEPKESPIIYKYLSLIKDPNSTKILDTEFRNPETARQVAFLILNEGANETQLTELAKLTDRELIALKEFDSSQIKRYLDLNFHEENGKYFVGGLSFDDEEKAQKAAIILAKKNIDETLYEKFKNINDIEFNALEDFDSSQFERYFKLVNEEDVKPDIAVSIVKYGFDGEDRINLENLSQQLVDGNRKLTKEEAITCISYGFGPEQVQSFINKLEKDYSGKKLDLFEAALCTVHNLDEDKIKRYFELKSKQLPYKKEDGTDDNYILTSQEAVLITKADLTDEELKRYAELKNKPVKYEAVRQHGDKAKKIPSTELIICYIQKDLSDEDIAKFAEFGFKDKNQYDDFQNILKIFGYNTPEKADISVKRAIIDISKLQDENGRNIFKKDNGEFDFRGFDLETLYAISKNELTKEQIDDFAKIYKDLQELPNQNHFNISFIAAHLAKLSNDIKSTFVDNDGNFKFNLFDIDIIRRIYAHNLTLTKTQDLQEISQILCYLPISAMVSFSLATKLAMFQDENNQNILRDETGKISLPVEDYHTYKYCGVGLYRKISDIKWTQTKYEDYQKALSALKEIPSNTDKDYIQFLALCTTMLNDTFKKENGEYDFKGLNYQDVEKLTYAVCTMDAEKDFSKLLPTLKNIPNNNDGKVSDAIIKFLELHKEILHTYKDENGNFSFLNNCDIDTIIAITENSLTRTQYENSVSLSSICNTIFEINPVDITKSLKLTDQEYTDYRKISSILKTISSSKNDNIDELSIQLSKLPEGIKQTYKDEEGNFKFDGFDIDALRTIVEYPLTKSQYQDFLDISSFLKTIPKYKENSVYISRSAYRIARLPDDIKDIYRDENGSININEKDFHLLETTCDCYLTKAQFEDFAELQNAYHQNTPTDNAHISKLPDEIKNIFRNEEGKLDLQNYSFVEVENIEWHSLNVEEAKDYLAILSILKTKQNKNKYDINHIAIALSKLRDEDGTNIFKKQNGSFQFSEFNLDTIHTLCGYTQIHCQNYLYLVNIIGLKAEDAAYIAINDDLMARFKLIDPNVFWECATDEKKKVFDLFTASLVSDNINGTKLEIDDFNSLPDEHSFNNGILSFNPTDTNKQSYSVSLQKTENEPIMIAKNQNGERETYIAYDGAIALLRPLQALTDEQKKALNLSLSTHEYFSIEQITALEEAARHFIIDIIQENGECIISKGIDGIAKPFIGKNRDTNDTKEKFKEVLSKLHNDSSSPNITIENILRLMPQDAKIQIKPYATSKSSHDILYSISAEWKDSNGKDWQMRVHSEDLKHMGKSWIYRVGYEDSSSSVEPLFYDNTQNDFIAGMKNADTHVLIEAPENYENKLISNPYFQKTIREISKSFNKTLLIKDVASGLNISTSNVEDMKNEIIEKCQEDAGYYYKYKKVVDNLLKEKGFLPFSSVA